MYETHIYIYIYLYRKRRFSFNLSECFSLSRTCIRQRYDRSVSARPGYSGLQRADVISCVRGVICAETEETEHIANLYCRSIFSFCLEFISSMACLCNAQKGPISLEGMSLLWWLIQWKRGLSPSLLPKAADHYLMMDPRTTRISYLF